jgi:hypothetical protein
VGPIVEYGASCWDPWREGQINASDPVQRRWLHLQNVRTIRSGKTWRSVERWLRCVLLETYTGEQVLKGTGDRYRGPSYLSRHGHGCKIRTRKERRNIGKYFSVNWTDCLTDRL